VLIGNFYPKQKNNFMTIYFSTNIPEMRSVLSYNRISTEIANSTRRLETGQRINTAQDDPTGLIVRESLRADIKGIQSAQKNVSQANSMLAIAESGMNNISSLLTGSPESEDTGLIGLIYNNALSGGEKKSMISDILDTIDSIARSTTYNGRQIINGALAYNYSGVDASKFTNLRINKANVPTGGSEVKIDLQQKADNARLALDFSSFTNSTANDNVIEAGTTLTIGLQNQSKVTYKFEENTEIVTDDSNTPTDGQMLASDLVAKLNEMLRGSGVTARLDDDLTSASAIIFESDAVGSDQILEVTAGGTNASDLTDVIKIINFDTSGYDFTSTDAGSETKGADAIVKVNGKTVTAKGLNLSYADSDLSFTTSLSNLFAKNDGEEIEPDEDTSTFRITGGGAMFQIGKDVVSDLQLRLGVSSVGTGYLGGSNGTLAELRNIDFDSDAGLKQAYSIVNDAVNSLAKSRAQLGSSQNLLTANTDHLDNLLTTVTESEGKISNTDTALESSRLARNELLAQMAMSSILYSRQFAAFSVSSLFG
jgi:flagellin